MSLFVAMELLAPTGRKVGVVVGAASTSLVTVGDGVGMREGGRVGAALGVASMPLVTVGDGVGMPEGRFVGAAVGLLVGDSVGLLVGDVVGVPPPKEGHEDRTSNV